MGQSGKMRMGWVLKRMVLRIHSCRAEGVYKHNLPWITGVEVETKRKNKRYGDSRVLRFSTTIPDNSARNACW
jgi:hypothetical protein